MSAGSIAEPLQVAGRVACVGTLAALRAAFRRPGLQAAVRRLAQTSVAAVGCAVLAMSGGCSRTSHDAGSDAAAAKDGSSKGDHDDDKSGDKDTVVLPPEMAKRLGVITTPAQSVAFTPGAEGFGVVLGHDLIAQIAADIDTARAAAKQSQATLLRAKQLANGPGALGVDAVENATKQTAADQASATLAQRKLTATLGLKFPRHGAEPDEAVLTSLANGTFKLVRVTFPPGALLGATPRELRLLPLESSSTDAASGTSVWAANTIWEAPQDPTIPGRSLFALLRAADIPEGMRLQALPVSRSGTLQGVLVPESAVVVSEGQYWCYLRKGTDGFTRTPITVDRPLAQGYFVPADRVAPGTEIVTTAAGLLLARQTNPSSESAD